MYVCVYIYIYNDICSLPASFTEDLPSSPGGRPGRIGICVCVYIYIYIYIYMYSVFSVYIYIYIYNVICSLLGSFTQDLPRAGEASGARPHAMPCHAMPCHAMLCYAMLCYAMLCYATLHYSTVPRCAVLSCAVLCHAVVCHTRPLPLPSHTKPSYRCL